jgi:hypothetical protein
MPTQVETTEEAFLLQRRQVEDIVANAHADTGRIIVYGAEYAVGQVLYRKMGFRRDLHETCQASCGHNCSFALQIRRSADTGRDSIFVFATGQRKIE